MFKKKAIIKTLSPLRSSDRRRTADRIISDYGLESAPPDGAADDESRAAATTAHTSLRNSLLPDNTLSAKFSTTSGPDLKEVNGTVFVGSHGAAEQRVLWVKIQETLYPSVYTLWHNPRIVPLLHTPSMVVRKIQGGADLMTPGLAGPPFPEKAKKGAIVAVASLDHPSVPVVVGTCLIDISSLQKAQGEKGHAVEVFHWAGDELWDWSTSGKSGTTSPQNIEGWDSTENELVDGVQDVSLVDNDEGGVPLKQEEELTTNRNDYVEGEDATAQDAPAANGEHMTTGEIDEAFWQAFLYGLHHQKQHHSSEAEFGLPFPLSQSFVIDSLVRPFLPTFTQQQTEDLVIKKTSWKNAKKFIKALDKEKLLLSKEQKSEVSIWDVDLNDPRIQSFRPYRLPKKDSNGTSSNVDQQKTSGSNEDDAIGQKIKVSSFLRPKESLATILEASNAGTRSLYTRAEISSIVTSYITSENLVPNNRRFVLLNPIISNAILSTSNKLDNELLAKGSIPRDALLERALSLCAPHHTILRNDEETDPKTKAKSGSPPKVGILLETRSGNKTATIAHGLEPFFINAQLLADELRKTCASSTSVEQWKGGKGMSVLVQGPQKDAMFKALERRGVVKAWVEVTDKTKGKKK
ncbi:MAG: hypothetical protein M1828_004878 [Chrysothrix sp. TS-e1954]|nr:MAG: hypothetical protein M1828_004878 [Chrysothrix sp. TS-e1954]